MIKLYQVTKDKRIDAKGFWKDEAGKIFVDNIRILDVNSRALRARATINFFNDELAIFYIQYKTAIIENSNGSVIELKNKHIKYVNKLSCKEIKEWLAKYGGVTVHAKSQYGYKLEAWSA